MGFQAMNENEISVTTSFPVMKYELLREHDNLMTPADYLLMPAMHGLKHAITQKFIEMIESQEEHELAYYALHLKLEKLPPQF